MEHTTTTTTTTTSTATTTTTTTITTTTITTTIRDWTEGKFGRYERGGGNAMIGPIGLYLLRFQGAVPHPKPPCEAGAAAGLVIQNVPPLLG